MKVKLLEEEGDIMENDDPQNIDWDSVDYDASDINPDFSQEDNVVSTTRSASKIHRKTLLKILTH